jgi:hypothetical protein
MNAQKLIEAATARSAIELAESPIMTGIAQGPVRLRIQSWWGPPVMTIRYHGFEVKINIEVPPGDIRHLFSRGIWVESPAPGKYRVRGMSAGAAEPIIRAYKKVLAANSHVVDRIERLRHLGGAMQTTTGRPKLSTLQQVDTGVDMVEATELAERLGLTITSDKRLAMHQTVSGKFGVKVNFVELPYAFLFVFADAPELLDRYVRDLTRLGARE